ncbi:unnamed protein product [Microthlaspi erraticum]|uniref:Uncharacterized protein n=1 Tax=Microthlaspi erraticum TaxID=1685480 RepID=A0A6D2LEI1_9BRAS|nr:unnamed protein product [Microthlaspi erraticum]
MAPPADDPSTRTGGLQSQLGADGNPIVHPVEVDATNGHVNPPPPPVLTCKLSSKSTTTRSTPSTSPATDESSRRDELSSRRRQEAPPRLAPMPRRMVRKTPTRKWPSCAATSTQSAPKCTTLSAPIVHPVEVDATNGHVNPPPPPVPDVEAPVTTAALTPMQGFAAQIASQFAEMQAQQQKYNDKIDSLHVTSDGRIIPTGRTLFQTPTRSTAATGSNAATNGEKDTDPEVAKLRCDLDAISSKCTTLSARHPRLPKSSPRRKGVLSLVASPRYL